MNAFPMGPGDRAGGLYGDQGSSQPELVDSEFMSFLGGVLWQQGIDVTRLGPDQYQQLAQALWEDTYIQDIYQHAYLQPDPLTGALITESDISSAMSYELFDPTRTHNQALLSQGVQLLSLSGRQLSKAQETYASNLGGGDPTVLQALARAAQDAGVPYNVALATAMAESGLNPTAIGDQGCSHGLFQLNTCGGEGVGMSPGELNDPYTNALTALRQFAAVAQADPSITSDPGRWAAAAQRPADPNGYAVRVNNLLQSGFGGSPSAIVPTPFDSKYFKISGYGYGAPDPDYASGVHEGIDYGLPTGTPLYTPFAGTVIAGNNGGYGNQVKVRLDNGYEISFAHMQGFSVTTGQRVNPGDLLGQSDSTGNSSGPHLHLEWRTPGGKPMDPTTIMQPIFSGTATFRSLNLTGAEGSGISATSARDRLLGIDPILEAKYPTAVSEFEKYFGRHPTSGELSDLINHGTTSDQLESYLRTQPSHIKGLSIGVYQDVKSNLDAVSQQLFGHPGTDGMVKELADKGMTSPTAVKYWLTQMDIAGKMDPGQYQTLYKLNQADMNAVYNEKGFDPRIAMQQYQSAQEQNIPVPSTPHHSPLEAFPYGPADRAASQGEPPGGGGGALLSTQ
jgi:soluble lytic murein transglycosylase-like protein